jgi:hypothetical protein
VDIQSMPTAAGALFLRSEPEVAMTHPDSLASRKRYEPRIERRA